MVSRRPNAYRDVLWQVPALVVVACLAALAVNQWRSDGIPLIGNWSADAHFTDTAGDSLVIPLEQAEQLFSRQAAVFIDARPESQYARGHIQGALSLPWQAVDRHFIEIANQLDGTKIIITYCDGESCELSHELALFLKEMAFENVRVLVNGWSVWQARGLPVAGDDSLPIGPSDECESGTCQ